MNPYLKSVFTPVLFLFLSGLFVNVQASEGDKSSVTLYQRLGGWEGVTKVVTDTVTRHKQNPAIAHYFEKVDTKQLISHVAAFFAAGTGGPSKYKGLDMTATHSSMGLSESDFNIAVADVLTAIKINGLDDSVQNEVNNILQSLKSAVLNVAQPGK